MDENLQKEIGIIIALKKHMGILSKMIDASRKFQSQGIAFGHYDTFDIYTISNWYDLRPKGVDERHGTVSLDDEYLDKFIIKCYFPADNKEEGFDYEIWKRFVDVNHIPDEAKDYPFITMAIINVTEQFVYENKGSMMEMHKQLSKFLLEIAEEYKISLAENHCAIFPSLGYSDFIILFLEKDISNVIQLLEGLRNKTGDGKSAILSDCYTVCGIINYSNISLSHFENKTISNVHLSIRINLKEGYSVCTFRSALLGKLEEDIKKSDESKEKILIEIKKEIEEKSNFTIGSSDCLILSDLPMYSFLPLLLNEGVLSFENAFYQKYILNTKTSLRLIMPDKNISDTSTDNSKPIVSVDNSKNFSGEELQKLIEKMKEFCKQHRLHRRTVIGFQIVIKHYQNLIRFSHCFDIRETLSKVLVCLSENLCIYMEIINEKLSKADKESDNDRKQLLTNSYLSSLLDFEKIINLVRDILGDYLMDLQRSDKMFIEGQSLLHPSIGSATKLLFFYNQYINNLAEEIEKNFHSEKKYRFVIISGGVNETTTRDIFWKLKREKRVPSLIIIHIPEVSLYDISGSMFRLLHECFHYCGERHRVKRAACLQNAIKKYLSAYIADIELGGALGENGFPPKLEEFCDLYQLDSHVKDSFKEIIIKERKNLADSIENCFNESLKSKYEGDLYFYQFKKELEDQIDRLFLPKISVKNEEVSEFTKKVCSCLFQSLSSIWQKVIEELKNIKPCPVKYSVFNILKEEMDFNKEIIKEDDLFIYNIKELCSIKSLLQRIAGNREFDCEENTTLVTKFKDIIQLFYSISSETYCDILAISLLGMKKEDYILAFLFENRNIDIMSPNNYLQYFRIGIVFKCAFHVTEDTLKENPLLLKERLKYWEDRGYSYFETDEDKLITSLNQNIENALHFYSNNPQPEIEDYVNLCLDSLKNSLPTEKSFVQTCKKIYKNATEGGRAQERQMLSAVMDVWGEMANAEEVKK